MSYDGGICQKWCHFDNHPSCYVFLQFHSSICVLFSSNWRADLNVILLWDVSESDHTCRGDVKRFPAYPTALPPVRHQIMSLGRSNPICRGGRTFLFFIKNLSMDRVFVRQLCLQKLERCYSAYELLLCMVEGFQSTWARLDSSVIHRLLSCHPYVTLDLKKLSQTILSVISWCAKVEAILLLWNRPTLWNLHSLLVISSVWNKISGVRTEATVQKPYYQVDIARGGWGSHCSCPLWALYHLSSIHVDSTHHRLWRSCIQPYFKHYRCRFSGSRVELATYS